MNKNLKWICTVAIGIALYVALSCTAKIPLIGNIALDLGYIALAVYCYFYGGLAGAIVGGAGCVIVSLLFSGWFPPGWLVGNIYIGLMCGFVYKSNIKPIYKVLYTVAAVFCGIALIKTLIECLLFGIPVVVKMPKSLVAFVVDAVVMSIGLFTATKIEKMQKGKHIVGG